jgi:hypothetical protein
MKNTKEPEFVPLTTLAGMTAEECFARLEAGRADEEGITLERMREMSPRHRALVVRGELGAGPSVQESRAYYASAVLNPWEGTRFASRQEQEEYLVKFKLEEEAQLVEDLWERAIAQDEVFCHVMEEIERDPERVASAIQLNVSLEQLDKMRRDPN